MFIAAFHRLESSGLGVFSRWKVGKKFL
jgi:hypothetical protein